MSAGTNVKLMAALALGAAGLVWYVSRRFGSVENAAAAAVGAVGSAATGAVVGVGQAVGIPATNMTQCQRDKAAGNWWDASFSCPAGDFISSAAGSISNSVFGSTSLNEAAALSARQTYALTDPRRVDQYSGGASGSW